MVLRNDDSPMPVIARHQRQIAEQVLRPRGNGAINPVVRNHLRNLLRCPLLQIEPHIRIAPPELADDVRQYIARLRVGRTYGEASPALVAQLSGQISNALRLLEDPQGPVDHLLSRRRYPRQVAPLA